MITVETKFNFKAPDLALQEELSHIAEKIFIPILASNIQAGRALDEGALPENDPKTIKRKGHGKPLIETGRLHRSFISFKRGANEVVVTLTPDRKEIGGYLQEGIRTRFGIKSYNFFGVSTRMEKEAMSYMESQISKRVKDAK